MYAAWWSMIGFGLKYWKYIVSSLAALALGFGAAWFIQGVRLNYAKSEVLNLKSQIQICQDANVANQETIVKLKTEIESAQSLCESRLRVKDKVISRLKEIDALRAEGRKRGSAEEEIKKDEKGIDATVDDPILHELNRMFNKADSKD
jgi:hypothetical protein